VVFGSKSGDGEEQEAWSLDWRKYIVTSFGIGRSRIGGDESVSCFPTAL
jgi:hypothetical protein